MEDTIYTRTEILLGKENVEKLKNSHVVICGVGGVGSYALEALARSGVGNITVIDKDKVDITNINRQLVASYSTIGIDKVDIAKKRVESVNKEARVNGIVKKIEYNDIITIVNEFKVDYVIDCIDDVEAKIDIVRACDITNTKCISSMGMGNRLNPLDIQVADIYKTNTCPLAKKIRKRLKELGDFSQAEVIQAFFACDKNEELTANYLFEQKMRDDEEDAHNQNNNNNQGQ